MDVERRIIGAALDVFVDEPNVPAELLDPDSVVPRPPAGAAPSADADDTAEDDQGRTARD